jgi:two-component system, OmpR family, phosphate regulon sensor histidine kinase PhoR
VKHIIEAHEGKIEVDSEVNEGTTFTVSLNKQSSAYSLGENTSNS